MQCEYCGGSVEWQGPLSNLTNTKCLRCGGINCQVAENAPLDDEDEIDNSMQQANHDICPHCLGSGECADTNSNGKCGYCGGTGQRS